MAQEKQTIMAKLKKGQKVKISSIGEEATIVSELGNGGQGTVYKVLLNGKEYAMKWYHKSQKQEFYNNLKNNVAKGTPNKSFLWALYLTEKAKDGTMQMIKNGDSTPLFGYKTEFAGKAFNIAKQNINKK